jgi:Bacterial regulatory helix-turn-helix proteins, AraC family
MSINILIADDEDMIRRGVAKYIKLHTDRFDKIYEAENGQEAIDLLLKYQPEFMILDVQMPLKTGLDVMKEAKKVGIHPITVILSGYDEFVYAQEAIKFGAREYFLKPMRASDILDCLNRLADEYLGNEEVQQLSVEEKNPFVQDALEYMKESYSRDISLSGVAKKLGISAGYLSTLLNQHLGCSFNDQLNQIRIDRASCYLEQNFLKNYEIAYKVGFKDEKYFSRVFKKIKGMSPKEYRMRKQQGGAK